MYYKRIMEEPMTPSEKRAKAEWIKEHASKSEIAEYKRIRDDEEMERVIGLYNRRLKRRTDLYIAIYEYDNTAPWIGSMRGTSNQSECTG